MRRLGFSTGQYGVVAGTWWSRVQGGSRGKRKHLLRGRPGCRPLPRPPSPSDFKTSFCPATKQFPLTCPQLVGITETLQEQNHNTSNRWHGWYRQQQQTSGKLHTCKRTMHTHNDSACHSCAPPCNSQHYHHFSPQLLLPAPHMCRCAQVCPPMLQQQHLRVNLALMRSCRDCHHHHHPVVWCVCVWLRWL